MRALLFPLLLLATPASAQFAGPIASPSGTASRPGAWRDLSDIRERIRNGRDAGQLSRREARGLRRETNQTGVLADRYGVDGLSDAEARELDSRTQVLRDQVNARRTAGMSAKR